MGIEFSQTKKQEKNFSAFKALRAAVAAAPLFSPLYSAPAEALEVLKNASWRQIMEAAQKSVLEKTNEHKVIVISYKDGSMEAVPPQEGSWNKIEIDLPSQRDSILEREGLGEIASVCDLHTHPLSSMRKLHNMKQDSRIPLAPPSVVDTSVDLWEKTMDIYKDTNIPSDSFVWAAADPFGIWYYRAEPNIVFKEKMKPILDMRDKVQVLERALRSHLQTFSDESITSLISLLPLSVRMPMLLASKLDTKHDSKATREMVVEYILNETDDIEPSFLERALTPELRKNLMMLQEEVRELSPLIQEFKDIQSNEADKFLVANETVKSFTRASFSSEFKFEQEYGGLVEAYASVHARVRFVPYAEVVEEPPCAGVDYVPQKAN